MGNVSRTHTNARMTKIVEHNGTIYLAGQVAKDRTVNDITIQTQTMLENVDELLTEAGSSREKILSATIYVKTMADFQAMNAVWDAWVPTGHAPARACVEAAMASPDLLVEVSIVAAK